jgi:hypothetical protein
MTYQVCSDAQKESSKNDVTQQLDDFVHTQKMSKVESEIRRARTIAEALATGIPITAIAVKMRCSHKMVREHLRYWRFIASLPRTVVQITEYQFQKYWKEEIDQRIVSILKDKCHEQERLAYEQKIFAQITARLRADQERPAPQHTPRAKSTTAQRRLHPEVRRFLKAKAQEFTKVYVDVEQDFDAIIALLGHGRGTQAPDVSAMHTQRLKRTLLAFRRIFKELGVHTKRVATETIEESEHVLPVE